MLGFAIPLLILGAILSAIGILLLSPPPFDKPAVLLCRATKTSAGIYRPLHMSDQPLLQLAANVLHNMP